MLIKFKKQRNMKIKITLLIATIILSGCASTTQNQTVQLSEQDDLGCQLYGLAGGMLAQRRDERLTRNQAVSDVKVNFARFDISAPRNRIAVEETVGSLDLVANTVFDLLHHKPKTLFYALLPFCVLQKTGQVNQARAASFFNKTLECQSSNPLSVESETLDRRDAQSVNLQQCINNNRKTLLGG